MSDYQKLLKDPRWQKRRLQIMNDAGFECENCGDEKKPLHVHHKYYEFRHKPWEYPNEALSCLCEDCHDLHHRRDKQLNDLLKDYKKHDCNIEQLIGYMTGQLWEMGGEQLSSHAHIDDYHGLDGLIDSYARDRRTDTKTQTLIDLGALKCLTHYMFCQLRKQWGNNG